MLNFLRKFDTLVHIVLLLLVASLFYMFLQRGERISVLEKGLSGDGAATAPSLSSTAQISGLSQEEVKNLIQESVALITPAPEIKVVEKQTQTTSSQVSFISLGGTSTTTSSDWVEVPGSEISLDLISDYGSGATASFEGFLKVAHSNGKAFARLFDDTNKIAVDGSEISVENKDTLTLMTTKNLPIWAGRNIYKVQIKSLNSFEITYGGGKLKIAH